MVQEEASYVWSAEPSRFLAPASGAGRVSSSRRRELKRPRHLARTPHPREKLGSCRAASERRSMGVRERVGCDGFLGAWKQRTQQLVSFDRMVFPASATDYRQQVASARARHFPACHDASAFPPFSLIWAWGFEQTHAILELGR